MTVSSTTNRVTYAGNGSTTAFSFPYYFLATADLIVTLTDNVTGAITTWALGTDFTVSGTLDANGVYSSGGTVTASAAPASGKTLSIVRAPSPVYGDAWAQGVVPAGVLQTSFDGLTLLVQRAMDLLARAITLPDGFTKTFNPQLPSVLTANYGLAVNSSGNGWTLVNFATSSGGGTVTSVGLSLPGEFSVGGAVTTSGTLSASWANASANRILAGPTSGGAATPGFRSLVAADIPQAVLTPSSMSSGVATSGQVPVADGSGGIAWQTVLGTGTVTSVGLSMPGIFAVGSSPVTTTGTLAVTLAAQTKNTVWAGPSSGSNATPTFRALVGADLPVMGGASSGSAGSAGATPQPLQGQQGYFLRGDASWQAVPGGTVTSVDLAGPPEFIIGGDPVTTTGTLTINKANQNPNTVWAGPGSGSPAAPVFRALVAQDLPVMTGASGLASGIRGAIPAPVAGQQDLFFRGDGNWSAPVVGTAIGTLAGLTGAATYATAAALPLSAADGSVAVTLDSHTLWIWDTGLGQWIGLANESTLAATTGSYNFRAGEQGLSSGSNSISVVFSSAFATNNYALNFTVLNTVDARPIFLQGVITARTASGFTITFNAPADTANYSVHYQAIAAQLGVAAQVALTQGSNSIAVVYGTAQANTNYALELSIENLTDAAPICLIPVITARSAAGFTATFNAPADTGNYTLHYTVRGNQ